MNETGHREEMVVMVSMRRHALPNDPPIKGKLDALPNVATIFWECTDNRFSLPLLRFGYVPSFLTDLSYI